MRTNTRCPNCKAGGLEPFYEARAIPVHSCMMFDDRETAVRFPARDLILGLCGQCGFISNVVFDPEVQEYTTGYEEQQSFSPRFRDFQTELCRRLIDKYGLHDKDVVEIGCGKGDFLVELCAMGGNRGVGIDPACDPSRMEGSASDGVRFVADYYSRAYADLPCDLLCCRHTLEHIGQTSEFVALLRDVVGDRRETLVFFEVPASERVLREGAFWDIYYEHCSYFSLGSLARVFRANRFDVLELAKDYDDQYLLLVARPSMRPTEPSFATENDVSRLTKDVQLFRETVRRRIADWRSRFAAWTDGGKRIAIWGSGSKCVSFLSTVGGSDQVAAVVDINPYRQGKYLVSSGLCIAEPESLKGTPPDVVVVMNPIYEDEIRAELARMGIQAELIAV